MIEEDELDDFFGGRLSFGGVSDDTGDDLDDDLPSGHFIIEVQELRHDLSGLRVIRSGAPSFLPGSGPILCLWLSPSIGGRTASLNA